MATSMGINSSMQCNKTAICNPDKNEIGLLMRPKGYVSSLNKPGLIHLRKKEIVWYSIEKIIADKKLLTTSSSRDWMI